MAQLALLAEEPHPDFIYVPVPVWFCCQGASRGGLITACDRMSGTRTARSARFRRASQRRANEAEAARETLCAVAAGLVG